ncbi:hypothetical protein SAMN05216388_101746 [Halorientalis persicus]|uniref:Uncharacterized protein n=1 Tax=Halorientalis persicus TaxID=1367881 RepID=A0A1H8RUA1_9EURY|nr:hypothetical protein [Halorientalis persicus]SEO70249.1 hypothetical protein SAMN05216388_101746 [Halorientalis persicus]
MPATYADKPTSEWDYSHALAEGDVLVHTDDQTGEQAVWEIAAVNDDGSVRAEMVDQSPGDVAGNPTEHWSEDEITRSLADDVLGLRDDGRSHELATF